MVKHTRDPAKATPTLQNDLAAHQIKIANLLLTLETAGIQGYYYSDFGIGTTNQHGAIYNDDHFALAITTDNTSDQVTTAPLMITIGHHDPNLINYYYLNQPGATQALTDQLAKQTIKRALAANYKNN